MLSCTRAARLRTSLDPRSLSRCGRTTSLVLLQVRNLSNTVASATSEALPLTPTTDPKLIDLTRKQSKLPPVTITLPVTTYPPPHITEYKPVKELTPSNLLKVYTQLSKARLTTLILLTAMSGVALSPLPASLPVLLGTAAGTALCCASANAINQIIEIPLDAQMARTRNRPLVRKAITPLHAATFAAVTGVSGAATLATFANPVTALLGVGNIVLYSGIYTPLKRIHVVNTWVGAVVGAIPPLMGWAACGGHLLPSAAHPFQYFPPSILAEYLPHLSTALPANLDNPLSALALGTILFSWQFPHFNALSRMVRTSYAQGGYKMLSITSPDKNTLVSLRHTLIVIGTCTVVVPLSGLTTWTFALTGLLPHVVFLRSAWRFRQKGGDKEARRLFHDSLWYLPVILGLMMFHKPGASWSEWWDSEAAKDASKVETA